MPISEKCQGELVQSHLFDVMIATAWVEIREYRRVKGTAADVEKWDAFLGDLWERFQAASDKDKVVIVGQLENAASEEEKTFVSNLEKLMASPAVPPAFNNTTCRMNWGEFACFCNWAAQQPPGQLVSLANELKPGQSISYKCLDAIRNEPKYASEWPKPPPPAGSASSVLPWVIGGVLVIGAGAFAYYKYGRGRS